MYFNNDIKINKFINRSDFNTYLNCMFRTNSSQNLTNELTPENKCYTMGNPEDTGVFQFDLKARKAIKNGRRGKFWGCTNYPRCHHTEDWNGN